MLKDIYKQQIERKEAEVRDAWLAFDQRKKDFEAKDEAKRTDDEFKALEEEYARYTPIVDGLNELKEKLRAELERGDTGPEKKAEQKADQPESDDRSPGERLIDSAEYKAMNPHASTPHLRPVEVMTNAEVKTLLTGVGAPGTSLLRNERLAGITPILRQQLQMSNLLTNVETSANTVEWVRHSATTNNAAEVAEATATAGASGAKPESAVTMVVENTTLQNIAHWIPATRQALSDMPQLRDFVNGELRDGVQRRLNSQILSGDAIAPNLRGILNTAGIGTQALGADTRPDAVFKAITTIRLAFLEPDAIVMHPSDWQDVRLQKDANGNYLFGPAFSPGEDQLWGLRVVLDTTITVGTALVGNFAAARLYFNGGIQLYTTDSHSDFFIRNVIVILAEGRFGIAVPRPAGFVQVTGI